MLSARGHTVRRRCNPPSRTYLGNAFAITSSACHTATVTTTFSATLRNWTLSARLYSYIPRVRGKRQSELGAYALQTTSTHFGEEV